MGNKKIWGHLFKHVDDFASAQPAGSGLCQWDLDAIRAICHLIRFEAQEEKEEHSSTTCLDMLGKLRVSEKNMHVLRTDLELWTQRSVALK